MKTNAALMAFCAAVSVLATQPAAAKSPAMEACSKQWDDRKAAGKTGDKTWPSFWSQCSKDFATNNGADATPASKPAKAEKTLKTVAATHNEDDTAIRLATRFRPCAIILLEPACCGHDRR